MPEAVQHHTSTPEWRIAPWTWAGWRPYIAAIAVTTVAFMVVARNLAAAEALLIVLPLLIGLQFLMFAVVHRNDHQALRSEPDGTSFAGRGRVRPLDDSESSGPARDTLRGPSWIPASLFVTSSGLTAVPDQVADPTSFAVRWADVTTVTSTPSAGRTLRGVVSLLLNDGNQRRFEFHDYRRLAPVLDQLRTG